MPRHKLGFISDAMSKVGAPCLRTIASDLPREAGFYIEENHLSAAEVAPIMGPKPSAGMVVSSEALEWNWRSAGREYQTLFHPENILTSPGGEFPRQWWTDPVTILTVYFEPEFLARSCSGDADCQRVPELRLSPTGVDPTVAHLFWALHSELRAGLPGGRLFAESIATVLAAGLTQRFGASVATMRKAPRGGLGKHALSAVLEYIRANPGGDLGLAKLARLAGVSQFHFCRLFKQSMNRSVHDYVLGARIDLARRLLLTTDLSTAEVAYRAGLPNLSHFTTVFRKRVGSTPSLFRAQAGLR